MNIRQIFALNMLPQVPPQEYISTENLYSAAKPPLLRKLIQTISDSGVRYAFKSWSLTISNRSVKAIWSGAIT